MKKILFVLTVAICSICMVGCQYTEDEFPKITESELQKCLMDKDEAVIFCTQDLCSGCEPVQKSLAKISRDCNIHIQAFDVDTDSAKKLLGQYGLDQVPAIIKISKESIELYKGNLTEENIKRLLLTESVIYDRISKHNYSGLLYIRRHVSRTVKYIVASKSGAKASPRIKFTSTRIRSGIRRSIEMRFINVSK